VFKKVCTPSEIKLHLTTFNERSQRKILTSYKRYSGANCAYGFIRNMYTVVQWSGQEGGKARCDKELKCRPPN